MAHTPAYAADTQPIRPEDYYPIAAWTRVSGISKARQREARLMGLPLPTFELGRRLYVRGHEGIAWMEALAAKLAEVEGSAK